MAQSTRTRSWPPSAVGPVRHSSGIVFRPAADRADGAQRIRLLVVDDDVDLRRALVRVLASQYDVRATDAVSALGAIRGGEHFDVILSDVSMPIVTGIMLFQAIEELSASLAGRVILMSGGVDALSRDFISRNKIPLLGKPVSIAALDAIVSSLCAEPNATALR